MGSIETGGLEKPIQKSPHPSETKDHRNERAEKTWIQAQKATIAQSAENRKGTTRNFTATLAKKSAIIVNFVLLFLFVALGGSVNGQVTIGSGTSTQSHPFNAFYGYGRSASIYTSSEIGTTGDITKLAWYVGTSSTTSIPIKIYLKTTSSTTFLTADTWSNLTSGATLVYNSTYSFSSTGWVTLDISSFSYTTDNLLVLCEANYEGAGSSSYPIFRYTSASNVHESFVQDNSIPTGSGSVNSNRPNIQLTISSCTAPTGGTISGSTTVCSGATGVTYTYSGGTPAADAWNWSVPTGATITAGAGTSSITVTFGATSGNVSCTPSTSGCAGSTVIKAVSVNTALPAISTPTRGSITASTATLGGNIISTGCTNITERGIYYSTTNGFADGAGTKVSETPGPYSTGTFSMAVSGLSASTTYYYKAFCTNSAGTVYTTQESFTTSCNNVSLTYSQGFNYATIPTCWSQQYVSGTSNIQYVVSSPYPNVTPQEGANYIFWNSYSFPSGKTTRLVSPAITTTGINSVDVEFQWFHDAGASSNADGVYVEYSTDGTNWTTVGSIIPRYHATLSGWNLKTVTLPAGAGNQANLYVGFKFYSAYGNNCSMDAIVIKPTPSTLSATSLSAFGNICTSTTGGPNTFTITGALLSGDVTVNALSGYTYSTTAGGTYTNTLTLSPSSGNINQTVYVKFAPTAVQSYNGNINISGGGATAIDVAATGSGIGGAPSITIQPANQMVTTGAGVATFTVTATGAVSYQWKESTDGGATWNNVTNGGIYGGATTANLVITNVLLAKNGYKYQCNVTGCASNVTTDGNATLYVSPVYCTPTTQFGTNGITRVIFNTIDNTTAASNQYINFTSTQSTTVTLTTAYDLSLYVNSGGNYTSRQKVWIDWNQDGTFNTTAGSAGGLGEEYNIGTITNVTNGLSGGAATSITVPAGATPGATRMRVSGEVSGYYATSCETSAIAEFEDYSIIVQSTPLLSASSLTGFGNVTVGSTAGPNNFTITGQYLTTADVTVGPLTGYTFSTTSGGVYTSTLSLSQTGGAYSQTIYVKFSPVAAQSYDGNIPVGGGGAVSINVPVTGTGVSTMAYLSSTTTQNNTEVVAPFTTNAEILCIKVVTSGSANPINATYLSFLTTGSTNVATDIGSAKLFYTGTTNTFSATNQFGSTKIQPNGRFSFTGTQALAEGTNYFWLAYDLPLTATIGNLIDARCDTVTVSDTVRTLAVTSPAGTRLIGNIVIMNNNDPESVCQANFYDGGGLSGNYINSSSYSKTFSPSAGRTLKMVFNSFQTADAADSLNIYDGPNTTYPLIGRWLGGSGPGTIIATSATGELTVTFKSDGFQNEAGWNALVTCEYLPPNCATYTSPADAATNVATNTPIVWSAGAPDATHNPATSYKLYFGTDAAATNIYNGTDIGNVTNWGMMLNTSTTYYWKIVPTNASGDAIGCSVIRSFTTAATQTVTTLTVNGVSNPPTSYANIKSAYDACTTATPYIINVTTGYAGETYPIKFNRDVTAAVTSRSAANPIIIRPDAGFTYTFKHKTNTILEFNGGAKYITIDGRQGGTGAACSFIFQDSSATTPTINFKDSASFITISYSKIQGGNQNSGIVDLRYPVGTGIKNITIDNNEICPVGTATPTDGIYSDGTAQLPNTNVLISNNKIYDIYADVASPTHGIYFGPNTFNFSCPVSGNSIYLTSTKTPVANNISWQGINVSGDNHVVSNNYIGGTAASCLGTPMTILGNKENHIYGIIVKGSHSSTTVVTGNTVNNISLSSRHRSSDELTSRVSSGSNHTLAGLTIQSGSATVSNNMIGGPTAGSITVINTNDTDPASINNGTTWGYSAELVGIVYSSEAGTINNSSNTVQGLWCYPSSSATNNLNTRVIGIYADPNGTMNTGYTHKITNNTIGGTGGLKSGNGTTSDGFAIGILSQHGRGNVYIKNNNVSNILMNSTGDFGFVRGIHNNGGMRAELENNTISNLVSAGQNVHSAAGDLRNRSVIGLICDNDGGDCDYFFIIKNTISDLRSTATTANISVIGLYYRHATAPVYGRVYGNKIFSINAATTATTSTLVGMWAYGQNTMTYNNMITLGNNVSAALGAACPNSPLNTGNYMLIGIENYYGKNEYYYNSVNIIGTSTGGSNTYAYKYTNSGTESLNRVLRNNIFSNTRSSTSGTQKNYAFSVSLNEAYAKFTSDYNYFYVSGTNGVLFDDFGTDKATIAAWNATSGKDANSTGTSVITPADPLFEAPATCDCNLNIINLTSPVVGTGSSIGIPSFILDDYNANNRNVLDNAGAVVVGATTLPIELLSFTGEKVENTTKLEWITASEVNNDYFTIERSMDGFHFEPIVKVNGAGNSNNLLNYEVIDENPMKGINYYRLKQTDYDGVFSYSHVIAINFSDNPYMVHVFPNPFNQNLNINIEGLVTENADIQIIDITGKLVFAQSVNKTDNTFHIDLDGSLPNGVYFMKLRIESSVQTFKIIKSNN